MDQRRTDFEFYDKSLEDQFPKALKVSTVPSWSEAKAQRKFWVSHSFDAKGAALDLLASAEWFDQIYPGYEVQKLSPHFFKKYFKLSFNQRVWLPQLAQESKYGTATFRPAAACLALWNEQGADILILGTSVTMRSLVDKNLSHKLQNRSRPLKILSCAMGGMTLEAMEEALKIMTHTRHQAQLVLIDYYNFFHPGRDTPAFDKEARLQTQELLEAMELFEIGKHQQSWIWGKPSFRFPLSSWDEVFPLHLQKVLSFMDLRRQKSSKKADEPHVLPTGQIEIDPTWVGSPKLLQTHMERLLRGKNLQSDSTQCHFDSLRPLVKNVIQLSHQLAPQTLFFHSPITPFEDQSRHCGHARVRSWMKEFETSHLSVLEEGWKQYGVGYEDFLFEASTPPVLRLDINHVNYRGAVKTTQWLVGEIKQRGVLKPPFYDSAMPPS